MLTSMLLCLSQLARVSLDFYDAIRDADAIRHVRSSAGSSHQTCVSDSDALQPLTR